MLVNNAEIAASGLFVGANLDSLEKLILLNAVAVMRLAGAVTPGYRNESFEYHFKPTTKAALAC